MKKLIIQGNNKLSGTVKISGSKNAALPILAAILLSEKESHLYNIPNLTDIETIITILRNLGVSIENRSDSLRCCVVNSDEYLVLPELAYKMRASICTLGPLIAKRGRAKVPLPGGCVIGERPIDLHLKGLRELGATIEIKNGYIEATAKKLKGREINLKGAFGSTVLGTANVLMAATLADGKTIIHGAACEPEIQSLSLFLVKMGAKISGIGTSVLEIDGVSKLTGVSYYVIPDRIEAGTLAIAGAITQGDILLENVTIKDMAILLTILQKIGVEIYSSGNNLRIIGSNDYCPQQIETSPFPGFPTDLQAQLVALLTLTKGNSCIIENIYPERFAHVAELQKMGANLRREKSCVHIKGVKKLSGADVFASDLRASAALVIAGLVAENSTTVHNIHHLQRGYENLQQKLILLGAKIDLVEE